MERYPSVTSIKYLIIFFCLFISLEYLYFLSRDTIIENILIDKMTIIPAASLINIFSEYPVTPFGHRLTSATVNLTVLNGCEGTEVMLILVAGILAFKSKWQVKIYGLITGLVFVYLLNQIRILVLFFTLSSDKPLFYALHSYIGPTIIVILTCIFFIIWSSLAGSTIHE